MIDLNADDVDLDPFLPLSVRVKQGMALLDDKHGPEWVYRIDVDTLRLESTCLCVLGQLYGDPDDEPGFGFGLGCRVLDLERAEQTNNGFNMPPINWLKPGETRESDCGVTPGGRWDALTVEWRSQILARRLELASA